MYAALGPRVQPYLWWKQHLTKLQMAQFLIFIAHSAQPLLIDCQYPKVDNCLSVKYLMPCTFPHLSI